jgi:competence protein ComEA
LALAAVAGALVVIVVGWPRGTAAGADGDDVSNGKPEASNSELLVEPSAASDEVVVDVDGKVKRPGVVQLPAGSRVIDAIEAAGGVRRSGDTGALNLAEMLIDGQQIVVPKVGASDEPTEVVPGSSTGTPAATPTAATVSINTADATELETLPGIGPVLAAAIVQWRTDNGAFTSVEQLQEVSGIGPATYAELAPLVRL